MKKKKIIIITIAISIVAIVALAITIYLRHDDIRGGFSCGFTPEAIMMGVKSNVNEFKVDDVNVKLYYTFYKNNEEGDTRKHGYRQESTDEILFGMYICNIGDLNEITRIHNGQEYEDYKKLPKEALMKEITEEEAFDTEYSYGCNVDMIGNIRYRHYETINIPQDLFVGEDGWILIRLVSFVTPNERNERYVTHVTAYLMLRYEYIDENTVKLEFEDSSN